MDYVVVSGASRKNEKWEHVEGETVSVEGKSEAEKLATDPMYRLEHGVEDQKKAEKATPNISKIMVCGGSFVGVCFVSCSCMYISVDFIMCVCECVCVCVCVGATGAAL